MKNMWHVLFDFVQILGRIRNNYITGKTSESKFTDNNAQLMTKWEHLKTQQELSQVN